VHARLLVVEKCVFKCKRPIETQILGVVFGQVAGLENGRVVLHKPVAERGPGEEVDGDGVLGAGLDEAAGVLVSGLGEY
jgi:hypothetical protein